MSKLDDILVPTKEVRQSRTYKEIKQQIRDLIIELIGDNEAIDQYRSKLLAGLE